MADQILDAEYVKIGDWVFATPACSVEDLSGVWSVPALRGADRAIPGQPGVAVRRRVPDAITFPLPVVVYGDAAPDGTPYQDVRAGLAANIEAMTSAIMPPSSLPYTRTLTHKMASGTTRTAACVVTDLEGPALIGSEAARFGIVVKIPSGSWTVTTP